MENELEEKTRDFTVAVFIVHCGSVLLHLHKKLGLWLPPGGHLEPNELPDEAALRETMEEAGIEIRLLQERDGPANHPNQPRQLTRPIGIQLESISSHHEHIDLIYVAVPVETFAPPVLSEGMVWLTLEDIRSRDDITKEILDWSERAISIVSDLDSSR